MDSGQKSDDFIQLRSRKRKRTLNEEKNAPKQEFVSYETRDEKVLFKRMKKKQEIKNEFSELPDEIVQYIVQFLDVKSLCSVQQACTRFYDIIKKNHFWRIICRSQFSNWNDKWLCSPNMPGISSSDQIFKPYLGNDWRRQFVLNSTKGMSYYPLSSTGTRRRIHGKITDTTSAYGFSKMCCGRDHSFILDYANTLHVYRWDSSGHISNEQSYRRVFWLKDFAKHVVDVTADPRYDNRQRRYVYVLSQSEGMRKRLSTHNTRNSTSITGWNNDGVACAGDKIDVFDERSCRRVFNMTFDPEMRFTNLTLTISEAQHKTLFMMTDAGKVYSLQLFEQSLMNLGSEGIQVTLKSTSKLLKEKIQTINSSVGLVSLITETGKLFLLCHLPSEFADLFGREASCKLGVPVPIPNVAKVITCSVGDRHIGFLDEYNRAFVMGSNRYGQLGTGDRMERHSPTQVLFGRKIKIFHCGLNHTISIIHVNDKLEILGTGCGRYGRLPGKSRGCIDFTKLDIEVPWNIRQIVTHKQCMFFLECFDINEKEVYRQTMEQTKDPVGLMATKTVQELFFDMGKAKHSAQKSQVLEAMAERIVNAIKGQSPSQQTSKAGSFCVNQLNMHLEDMIILHKAAKQLRYEIEGTNLDNSILNEKQSAPSNKI